MKKQLIIKIIISILIVLIAINFFYISSSMALGNVVNDGKSFLGKGNGIYDKINKTALQDTSNMIYNIFLAIGIIAAVIIGMVIGIKIMVASADEKAKVKESLLPFLIGCIVIFGSFTIWKVVITIGNDAEIGSTSATPPILVSFDEYMADEYPGDWWAATQAISNMTVNGKSEEELIEMKSLVTGALVRVNSSYSQSTEITTMRAKLNNLEAQIEEALN